MSKESIKTPSASNRFDCLDESDSESPRAQKIVEATPSVKETVSEEFPLLPTLAVKETLAVKKTVRFVNHKSWADDSSSDDESSDEEEK